MGSYRHSTSTALQNGFVSQNGTNRRDPVRSADCARSTSHVWVRFAKWGAKPQAGAFEFSPPMPHNRINSQPRASLLLESNNL